jgi:predicted ATPase
MFIDAIKTRNIQIILESHSEHLLRRLQRRIAEEQLSVDEAALYFVNSQNGESNLEELQLDPYGNITNWPPNFFGDELGELAAMTEAAIRRSQADQQQSQAQ